MPATEIYLKFSIRGNTYNEISWAALPTDNRWQKPYTSEPQLFRYGPLSFPLTQGAWKSGGKRVHFNPNQDYFHQNYPRDNIVTRFNSKRKEQLLKRKSGTKKKRDNNGVAGRQQFHYGEKNYNYEWEKSPQKATNYITKNIKRCFSRES